MKRNLLNSAALVLLCTQRTLATHKAFAMLEQDEEEVPPYEVLTAGNLSAYEISSFYEVDELGKIIGQGAIAFTLHDIVYTDERLLCETADCCAARNYSYDPFYEYGENYFPPCETHALLDTLSDACRILPSNTSLTADMLDQNISSTCDYYTLYNHSNLSSTLVNCVQNTLLSRWPGYCEGQQIDMAIPGVALATTITAIILISVWIAKQKTCSIKGETGTSFASMSLVSVAEVSIFFSTAVGFIYTWPKLLNEYNLNLFTPSLFPAAKDWFMWVTIGLTLIRASVYSYSVGKKSIAAALAMKTLYSFGYASLKALSIFTLTLEFYDSQFGYTDNFLQAVVGSSLMGAIAFVKTLRDLRVFRICDFIQCLKKYNCHQDYLSHVYPHIHVLLTSLLTPVICGSFLETFSTMTITAGRDLHMQTASYLTFLALSYCANILATKKEGFEFIHESILEFLESWAFFHSSYLRIVTHQESIDTSMFYYYYTLDPLTFAALLAPVRVLYLFYQWSASQLPKEITDTLQGHHHHSNRRTLTTPQAAYIDKHFPELAHKNHYQLLIQATDNSEQESPHRKYNLTHLTHKQVNSILLESVMGGHHIHELIEFFTVTPEPEGQAISATHPMIKKASDTATAANQACHAATAYAHQGSLEATVQSAQESIKAFNEATKLIVMTANLSWQAHKKDQIANKKENELLEALADFHHSELIANNTTKLFDIAESDAKGKTNSSTEKDQAAQHAKAIAHEAKREYAEAQARAAKAREDADALDSTLPKLKDASNDTLDAEQRLLELNRNKQAVNEQAEQLESIARDKQARAIETERSADRAAHEAAEAKKAATAAQAKAAEAKRVRDQAINRKKQAEQLLHHLENDPRFDAARHQASEASQVADEIKHLMKRANRAAHTAYQQSQHTQKTVESKDSISEDIAAATKKRDTASSDHASAMAYFETFRKKPSEDSPLLGPDFGQDTKNMRIGIPITATPANFKIKTPTAIFILFFSGRRCSLYL